MDASKLVAGNREEVIQNIKQAVAEQRFNDKVETNDPVMTMQQQEKVVNHYLHYYENWRYKVKNVAARSMLRVASKWIMRTTKVVGSENIQAIKSGAIVTSNHFSPIENTVVSKAMRVSGKSRLFIVSEATNLEMKGFVGFVMNFYDTIPMSTSTQYMARPFPNMLADILEKKHFILIYPEQEMWFNYRKPRPPKRGAYYYAARFNVPIISCFVEIVDTHQQVSVDFNEVQFIMHILKPIYPDATKNVHENSLAMMQQDYDQKCAAYERAYGKKLTYEFTPGDIAGWIPQEA
ncbi:hypothetical protein C5L31_000058 [Secundilactobacillus malefermentans]|uniref:Phospholipid/glycerol acyltransferase domain-containing protein n=1 Tax=Secundilactobacillus malefermentans TaxID=176292 RepID=A0A4R5NIY2_9LACO|nr:lysophospholipid acyltransferase family protein [Secundilactobacillus malefermentans]KRM59934.1 1-acyl-sn-glycerol-3-phosphate acyltransferase [Secundilactobacillus malefermentans DSM 5705 = KCTC 3548]TDG74411.1 hypothetical protein C5L31_000058 [Secundilactobacillus malefermentans]